MAPADKVLKHGTRSTYNRQRCRCAECRKAATDYRRELRYRHRVIGRAATILIPAEIAQQRLAALRAEGWEMNAIAREVGCDARILRRIQAGQPKARAVLVAKILELPDWPPERRE